MGFLDIELACAIFYHTFLKCFGRSLGLMTAMFLGTVDEHK